MGYKVSYMSSYAILCYTMMLIGLVPVAPGLVQFASHTLANRVSADGAVGAKQQRERRRSRRSCLGGENNRKD